MNDQSSQQFLPLPGDAVPDNRGLGLQVRKALIALAILVFGLGFAAAFIPMGGAVIGTGHIGMESRAKRVTHPSGGVIAQIFVKNGDHVRAGDVLVRLDDGVSGNQSSLAALSVQQLQARQARLEAEQLGLDAIRFPANLTQSNDPGALNAVQDEQRLFQLRANELRGQRSQMAIRITQTRREIGGYQAQISALQQQDALILPEREGIRDLWARGLVTVSRKNELERTAVELHGSIGALRANIAQAEARIAETRQQMITLGETRRSDAGAELGRLKAALNDQQLRSVAANDTQNRSTVRAAYDGVVDKLAFSAIGDVIRPAEPIMDIMPDKDELMVDASISPNDIEQVHVGQAVRIRLSSLNSTATPEFSGKITYVAADQTVDSQRNTSFFAVRVAIDPASLANAPGVRLRSGMPAEIFVETGSRSMLSYLTKPIFDQLARAFRDN